MIRLVVFDCDGTLVDSQHVIVRCMQQAFAAEGLAVPDDGAVRHIIGLALPRAVEVLAPEADAARNARLVEGYKAQFVALHQGTSVDDRLFPGAYEAVSTLAAAGYALAVATGKGRAGLATTLSRHALDDLFHSLHTADDAPSKPHPAMLEQAMAEAGVGPRETVIVGDTVFDIEMGANAGVAAVGVSWGYHAPAALRQAGARAVIDHFRELTPLIESWPGGR